MTGVVEGIIDIKDVGDGDIKSVETGPVLEWSNFLLVKGILCEA